MGPQKLYITKYALTQGIKLATCQVLDGGTAADVNYEHMNLYYHRNEWHKTWDSALAQAKEMQAKRIFSLKRDLLKVRKLEFTEPK